MEEQHKIDKTIIGRTIGVGLLVNMLLAISKLWVGTWGHSQALVADGFHSLSDVVTDGLIYVTARYSRRSADRDHPYGHGRFETLATTILALILLLVALGIIYDALTKLSEPVLAIPDRLVLWVAVVSVGLKEGLYWFTKAMAKQVDSNLLLANAWHHRSDAASSIVVIVAVIGVMWGWSFLDAIAALVVGVLICSVAIQLMRSSVRELVDAGVDDQMLKKIKTILLKTEGVLATHQLRTRLLGGKIFVDVHALVPAKITVSEGHYIAEQARRRLIEQLADVVDVTVHIDPEDDETHTSSIQLQQRKELEKRLRQACIRLKGAEAIEHIRIHYLSGQLQVELYLPVRILEAPHSPETLQAQYQQACQDIKQLRSVRLVFTVGN